MWKVVTAGCAQICTRLKTKRTFQCQCSTLLGITAKHSCKSLLYNKHVCTSCRTAPVHNMFVRFLAIANTLFVCSPKTKKSKHAANMWMQDLSTRLGCALTMNENHSLNTHENWHGKTGWESTKPPANCPTHLASTSKILKTSSNQAYLVLMDNSLPQRERLNRNCYHVNYQPSSSLPESMRFPLLNLAGACKKENTFKNEQWLGNGWGWAMVHL